MKIPYNLKPGDRPWYSEMEYAIVVPSEGWPTAYSNGSIRCLANGLLMWYNLSTGIENYGDSAPITRIERVTSAPKKARDDRDAVWMMRVFDWKNASCDSERRMVVRLAPVQIGRLRAIARRLNGGRKAGGK